MSWINWSIFWVAIGAFWVGVLVCFCALRAMYLKAAKGVRW